MPSAAAAVKVRVNRSACRGARQCIRRAPDAFKLDEAGKAVFSPAHNSSAESIRAAAKACPFFAIELREKTP